VSNLKTRNILAASVLLLGMLACNSLLPADDVRPSPTPIVFPTHAEGWLPGSDAEVPRVTVEEAVAAFETGEAIIVDVRDPAAYADGHVPGALSIPLSTIDANPTGLDELPDKNQWIITYCT